MLPYQLRLRELEKSLIKEHINLNKSKKRLRSQNDTEEIRAKIHETIVEHNNLFSKLEYKLPFEEWNEEVLRYNKLKLIFNKSNKILDETKIIPPATFKAVVKAIIFC